MQPCVRSAGICLRHKTRTRLPWHNIRCHARSPLVLGQTRLYHRKEEEEVEKNNRQLQDLEDGSKSTIPPIRKHIAQEPARAAAHLAQLDDLQDFHSEVKLERYKKSRYPSSVTEAAQQASGASDHYDDSLVELSRNDLGKRVVVSGFVHNIRTLHQNLAFIELLDQGQVGHLVYTGHTVSESLASEVKSLQRHTPIRVHGRLKEKVRRSGMETDAPFLETVEIEIERLEKLNRPPRDIITPETVFEPEARHLQLRTDSTLLQALRLRADVTSACRKFLEDEKFLEVETPLLYKSTPEGAREFLVPTRKPGLMYALPQSPQQYKQILMASGIRRYYQIARCFRDEDSRADRQMEFTQLDMEMSFATGDKVMDVMQRLVRLLWWKFLSVDVAKPEIMTYHDAISTYGTDKPDTRFDFKIKDVSALFNDPDKDNIYEAFGVTEICLRNATQFANFSKQLFDNNAEKTKSGTELIVGVKKPKDTEKGQDFQKLNPLLEQDPELAMVNANRLDKELNLRFGNLYVIAKRRKVFSSGGSTSIGDFRILLHDLCVKNGLMEKPKGHNFLWVKDFPLFTPITDETDAGHGGLIGYKSTHHPFTAPIPAHKDLFFDKPFETLAWHYDLVVNGVELGGGSTRIHDAAIQEHVFNNILKLPKDNLFAFKKFVQILNSGCPPHAGMALGFDRLIAILHGTDTIRDVIAFPKTAGGRDPMVGSPAFVPSSTLTDYHLRIDPQVQLNSDAKIIYEDAAK